MMCGWKVVTNRITTGFRLDRNSPVNPLLSDNISFIRGKHTFKTGFRYSKITQYQSSDSNIWPTISLGQGNGNAAPATIGPQGAQISATDRARFDNFYNDMVGRVASVQ